MILNIYGPSGSGKTTFIRDLLNYEKTHQFYEYFTNKKYDENLNKKISISLIPLPIFRGTLEEYLNIFSININVLLNLDEELNNLAESIFEKVVNKQTLEKLSIRNIETLSAGEMRRLFLLKSLIVDSNIVIIDEPFSNSDEKLWNTICNALKTKSRLIILSHLALENFFESNQNNVFIPIEEIREKFNIK